MQCMWSNYQETVDRLMRGLACQSSAVRGWKGHQPTQMICYRSGLECWTNRWMRLWMDCNMLDKFPFSVATWTGIYPCHVSWTCGKSVDQEVFQILLMWTTMQNTIIIISSSIGYLFLHPHIFVYWYILTNLFSHASSTHPLKIRALTR